MNSVSPLGDAGDIKSFGGKAANLAKMLQFGLPVPDGIAVGLGAFSNDNKLTSQAKSSIKKSLKPSKLYAVRSSALAEDAEGASWAGQFETFLNVKANDVIKNVEKCHSSTKDRAKAYAAEKDGNFNIAVVVQEMVQPEYAGVLFTKDPITGEDHLVTEYVEGLGEELVSGRADPKQIVWQPGEKRDAPFSLDQLTELAQKVEKNFDKPQDIEWAWADDKMWLVQTRPITTTQEARAGYHLGEPEDLFYWGPSRAKPLYMSDFMAAVEKLFTSMAKDPDLPDPPRTLVLFHADKMVWLNNAKEFSKYTRKTFAAYEKRNKLDEDVTDWRKAVEKCDKNKADARELVKAWEHTLFAEFSLYGAESALARRLERFDPKVSQKIWGAFTVPDNSTFLARIDDELLETGDPDLIAKKYPWIEDGYSGTFKQPAKYFSKRLKMLRDNQDTGVEEKADRDQMAKDLKLSKNEVNGLDLARKLSEFMDDRKEWMMRTRQYVKNSAGKIEHGWLFDGQQANVIGQQETADLWERYVDFKASTSVVHGIVASNGGRHFINGKAIVVTSPTDIVPDDCILVVPATSPSYVPLMRQAKALITDHGGMMSHAAIVAREFNLPCIVGTKQATKVLKNGDKVVLDLVKGEVSK